MSYLTLLLTGQLPPTGVLLARSRHRDVAPSVPLRRQTAALGVLTALAVSATLPWDSALIARGTWSYPHGQLLGRLYGVPVEELLFMFLQPVLVGLWLRNQRPALAAGEIGRPSHRARASGTAAWLAPAGAGAALGPIPNGSYLGGLLMAAAPLLAPQWAVGGDRLWARRRLLLAGTMVPVLYLCAVDRLALHLRLWQLSNSRTTGLAPFGLPVEEALFFALTTLLIVSGLLLATDQRTLTRLRGRLPRSHRPVAPVLPAHSAGEERRLSTRRPAQLTPLRQAAPVQPRTSPHRDQSTKGVLR